MEQKLPKARPTREICWQLLIHFVKRWEACTVVLCCIWCCTLFSLALIFPLLLHQYSIHITWHNVISGRPYEKPSYRHIQPMISWVKKTYHQEPKQVQQLFKRNWKAAKVDTCGLWILLMVLWVILEWQMHSLLLSTRLISHVPNAYCGTQYNQSPTLSTGCRSTCPP